MLLDFWRSLAVKVRQEGDQHAAEARQLVKLIDLHRRLREPAQGADAAQAEGLAAAVLPAIRQLLPGEQRSREQRARLAMERMRKVRA